MALYGTGGQAIHWMLEQNTYLRDMVLCLGHDEPERTATKHLEEELQEAGYYSGILLSVHKGWNNDLVQRPTMVGTTMTIGQSMQAAEAYCPPGGQYTLPLNRGSVHFGPPRRSHWKVI